MTQKPLTESDAADDAYPILLVDDDSQIHELLQQVAQNEFPQSQFHCATSFTATVDYLENLTGLAPRLILLDVDLKASKNGLDVLRWIRDHPKYRPIPVVMLSVLREESLVDAAYKAGANIFTNKPYDLSDWREYVHYLRDYWYAMASTPRVWVK
jgi:CheY-like chemotaxis protein